MIQKPDPYKVLGIGRGASKEEIKQQYKRLAKIHHPDRWAGKNITPEELHQHQETFKNITVAYHLLMDGGGTGGAAPGADENEAGWETLWKTMEDFLTRKEVLENVSSFIKRTFKYTYCEDADAAGGGGGEYHFTIPVALEDIHNRTRKRVRLIPRDGSAPIYLTVLCDHYPEYETLILRNGCSTRVRLVLRPSLHPLYTLDDWEGGACGEDADETEGFNLFRSVPMTLYDYFVGKQVEWTHLDGTSQTLLLPPFLNGRVQPLGLWEKRAGGGLLGKGDLYITLDWRFPCETEWGVRMSEEEKAAFILILEKLTHQ